jgi:hypothetical protein
MYENTDDFPEAQYGDGVSRPVPGQATASYKLKVKLPGAKPMTCWLNAESSDRATAYATARWPHALITLLDR